MKNRRFIRFGLVLTAMLLVMLLAGSALAAGYVEATGNRVNVRSGPGTNYDDLWTMIKGERVEYLGVSSSDNKGVTWYKVQYYSYGTGWISSALSRLVGTSSSSSSYGSYVQAYNGDVYVRTAPSLNGGHVSTMMEGQTATYLGNSSVDDRGVTWYQVNFKGKTGWVSSRYSKLYGSGSVSLPDFSGSTSYGTVKITGGKVNVRNAPNLNGDDLGTVYEGATLTYLGSKSVDDRGVAWYQVSYKGRAAWVSSRYSKLY